jgi:HEAT repeat protein
MHRLLITLVFVLGWTVGMPACRGLVAAEAAADPVAMTIDLLRREDVAFRQIGLDAVRHATKGETATYRYAALLSALPPTRQIELLSALCDRGDAAAVPSATALLAAGSAEVRSAAIEALGALGSGVEVEVLKAALARPEPEKSAARQALVRLRGKDATRQIAEAARSGDPVLRGVLIDILAERRDRSILPDLLIFVIGEDAAVRTAAMRFLGRIGGPDQVKGMVAGLLKAEAGSERSEAEKAIVGVCTQNSGNEQAAARFLEDFQAANDADRETLLPTLGRIGGPEALDVVDRFVSDGDPARRSFGIKALTLWPDADVAARIMKLFATSNDVTEKEKLLGALIRIAPLPNNKLNDKQKLELVAKTMQLCGQQADKARLLERVNAIRTIEAFRFVLPYLDEPGLVEPACKSIVELAHHQKLRDAHKEEFVEALDRVIATTKNEELVERAGRYKEGKTWERKKG